MEHYQIPERSEGVKYTIPGELHLRCAQRERRRADQESDINCLWISETGGIDQRMAIGNTSHYVRWKY